MGRCQLFVPSWKIISALLAGGQGILVDKRLAHLSANRELVMGLLDASLALLALPILFDCSRDGRVQRVARDECAKRVCGHAVVDVPRVKSRNVFRHALGVLVRIHGPGHDVDWLK